jgi:hypothetical protein
LWAAPLGATHPYAVQYGAECEKALAFYTEYENEFKAAAGAVGCSSAFLFAIIAPEYTQFNYLSNKIETISLKMFYVQGKKSYANFSIGFFQMKPSFVEQMEDTLLQHYKSLKERYSSCLITAPNIRTAKIERMKRLEQLIWQFRYLSLFYDLVTARFEKKQFVSDEEKLLFYASAYNTGFHKSETDIEQIGQKALFPHFASPKYRYNDIALWFYKQVKNST